MHNGRALPAPYELVVGLVTIQPWLPFAKMEQSVELINVLVCVAFGSCVHPCGGKEGA